MGWQDDEVVSQPPAAPAAASQPAWAQDEVVSQSAPPPVRPPQQEQPSLLSRYMDSPASFIGPAGIGETAANIGTNMVATPLAGLAGLGAAATNAIGLTNTRPGDVVNSVSDALTYQPKTYAGKAVTNVVTKPFQWLAQGAQAVAGPTAEGMEPTGLPSAPISYSPGSGGFPFQGRAASPAIATVLDTSIQAAPSLFLRGPKGAPRVAAVAAEAPKPAPQLTPRQVLIDELQTKGLKVTPTQAGKKGGSIAEGLTGSAKLERSVSIKNAKRVNELVGEDVGLKGAKEITQADLNRLYVDANKPYNAIAKTGTRKVSAEFKQEIANISDGTGGESFKADVPKDITRLKGIYGNLKQFTAQDAVNKIRQLRSEASKNIKAPNAPEQNAKGYVQRKIADALDNELTRHVESLGKPELAAEYKAARVQLAKLHTLEDALDGSNVSAADLARAKDRGAPLSGNMDLVARAHTEFDRSFQNVSKIRDSSPVGVLDGILAVAGGSVNPALVTAIAARPATRAILASDAYQRRLTSGVEKPAPSRADGASKEALARPAVAAPERKERRK